MAAADVVILEDYGKGVLSPEVIAAAVNEARKKGVPVVVDPVGRDYARYKGVTILTPNLKEAAAAAERPITDMASLEAAAHLLVEQTAAAVAVTREAEGISLFRRPVAGGPIEHTHVPTVPVAVYDVTGAGDAVVATMAIALASTIEMADAWLRPISPGGRSCGSSASAPSRRPIWPPRPRADRPTGWSRSPMCPRPASVRTKSSRLGARSSSPTAVSTSCTTATPISCNTPAARATSSFSV